MDGIFTECSRILVMAKKKYALILLLFIILGLYLRISGTLNGYFAFTFDQGRDFLQLYDLVYRHKLSLIGPPTGIDGVFHGVWWYWFLAPLFLSQPEIPLWFWRYLARSQHLRSCWRISGASKSKTRVWAQ